MTDSEKSDLFRRLFRSVEGEAVLDVLKEDLGYNSRTALADTDRRQCYILGRANAVQYILDTIQFNHKQSKRIRKNGRKSKLV